MKHPLGEVDVRPFERHHLPAPKPSISAQKNNEMRDRPHGLRQPFIIVEVIEVWISFEDTVIGF